MEDYGKKVNYEVQEEYRHFGFSIRLTRNTVPFIFGYYVPVAGMVLVASMSFWIPPDCIPGRVALLITLALTLINYFNGIQVHKKFIFCRADVSMV